MPSAMHGAMDEKKKWAGIVVIIDKSMNSKLYETLQGFPRVQILSILKKKP